MIRTSSIGDVVLATAAGQYARAWSQASGREISIHWLTSSSLEDLAKSSDPDIKVHRIEEVVAGRDQTLPEKIDLIVDLQGTWRTRRLASRLARRHQARLVRSKKRYLARLLSILTSRLFGRSKLSVTLHQQINRWLPVRPQYLLAADAMAKAINSTDPATEACRPRLSVATIDSRISQDSAWLAVAPGAAHPTKKAPIQVFERILGSVAASMDDEAPLPGIVLLGSEEEIQDCQELQRRLVANGWDSPVLNLGGMTSLTDTMAVLAGCRAILGNDSSLGHIAESLGKPAFILFGPTSESFGFGPHLPKSRALSVTMGCRPCSRHGKANCRYEDQACFNQIDTSRAGTGLAELLNSGSPET